MDFNQYQSKLIFSKAPTPVPFFFRVPEKPRRKEKSGALNQEPILKTIPPLPKRVDISPGKEIEDRTEEEKEIQNIMKHLVKTLPDEDRMTKRYKKKAEWSY